MATTTQIEWTDATWNPVTGCSKLTRGCERCYAHGFSERFRGVSGHPFENGFDLTLRPERLTQPLTWRQSRRIFVNSMSDLFHKEVPIPFIDGVFDTMEAADWHTFQVLTKRSSLMSRYLTTRYGTGVAPPHIWVGVSIEDARNTVRLKHLSMARASTRFISFEPLLGPVGKVDLTTIDWVIVGGESGPKARPMAEEWAVDIRDQCRAARVAFFFKQWGGIRPKTGGVCSVGGNGVNTHESHSRMLLFPRIDNLIFCVIRGFNWKVEHRPTSNVHMHPKTTILLITISGMLSRTISGRGISCSSSRIIH